MIEFDHQARYEKINFNLCVVSMHLNIKMKLHSGRKIGEKVIFFKYFSCQYIKENITFCLFATTKSISMVNC